MVVVTRTVCVANEGLAGAGEGVSLGGKMSVETASTLPVPRILVGVPRGVVFGVPDGEVTVPGGGVNVPGAVVNAVVNAVVGARIGVVTVGLAGVLDSFPTLSAADSESTAKSGEQLTVPN